MAFIPIPNTVMVEMIYDYDGQICENVYHYTYAGTPNTVDMLDLAAWMVNWWNTNLKTIVPVTLSLTKVKITDLTTQTGPVVEYDTPLPSAGTYAQPQLPNHVTLVVKWHTAQRGRSYRGRTYHIGISEDQVTLNEVHSSFITTGLGPAYDLLMAPVTTVVPTMVVASRYTNNAPRAAGITTPITHITINNVVDSQRRRLPDRGA